MDKKKESKFVALDIGNVCIKILPERAFGYFGIKTFEDLPHEILIACDKLETGKINEDEWLKIFGNTIDTLLREKKTNHHPLITDKTFNSLPLQNRTILDIWNLILGPPIEGMETTIKTLINKGFKFVFFSDTSRFHLLQVFRTLPFAHLIYGGIYSFEVGAKKPHTTMYEAFEKSYGKPIFYLDDKQENIRGARQRGWLAHQFTDIRSLHTFLKENFDL